MIEQIKQNRIAQILLGIIVIVVCFGCLGLAGIAAMLAGGDRPAVAAVTPTAPPAAGVETAPVTTAPTATPLPSPTAQPVAELGEETKRAYLALMFLEGSMVMLEETANQAQAGQTDGFETLGQLLGIGIVLKATSEAMATPAPDPKMQPAWAAAGEAVPLIQDTIKRWLDQEITAPEVVPALVPAHEKLDQALSLGDAVMAGYGVDPAELAALREEAMAGLRQSLAEAQAAEETAGAEPAGEAALKILSLNDYVDSIDYLHIVGEVENQSDRAYAFVEVVVTLYDEAGNVVSTDFTYSAIDILLPGQKTPFEVTLDQHATAIRYEAQVSGRLTNEQPYSGLTIANTSEYVDDIDYWHLVGEVVNEGQATVEFVKLVITLYNEAGEVVDTDFTYARLDTIPPGGRSPFELSLSNEVDFASYQVQVQGRAQ